ncbi:Stk1 family PASTA domain-containing Ser/Thr kinase [soil metagenome]
MQDLVGATLGGRYRLIVRLAGGGMGEVYKSHDLLLDRPVAVKILQHSLASDPNLVERFKAEARAAARLTHHNVVAVYDWGSEDERTYFMVMEYVAGTDLRDLLVSRGCLEAAQAAEIVACVCDALQAAHRCGLVHRDIKPENVLIARDGKVKVADFGIAIVADMDRTMPGGMVPGTLRYLSPEQAEGRQAAPASDIWAAGAVLSELVTGQPPLQGAGTTFLHRRASEPPVPPSRCDARVPRDIDDVVLRACAVDAGDRFGGAAEMANALRRASVRSLPDAPSLDSLVDELTGEIDLRDPVPTRLERRRKRGWRRRLKVFSLACLVVALLLGGAAAAATLLVPSMVEVPELIGEPTSGAARRVEAAGLGIEIVDREPHFGAQPGEVVSQVPGSGRLEEGSTVRVVVSSGAPPQDVPRVVGLAMDEATLALELGGLEIGDTGESYSGKPEGTVIAQSPSDGEAPWASEVDLVASKGPVPVGVPSLEGTDLDKAKSRLAQRGFEVTVAKAYSGDVRAGEVVHTTPAAGEIAPQGSRVEVVVSLGPEFAKLEMPDVRNMSVGRARDQLARYGLRARVVQSCAGTTVVETDPIQGTTVRENDLVALFVC